MSLERSDSGQPPRFLLLLPPAPSNPTHASLKSAYSSTIIQVLQEVALHSPECASQAAVLEIGLACPHLVGHHQKSRASLYHQTQSLLAGIYKLITVVAAQEGINVEDADGVDVRVILVAWDGEHEDEVVVGRTPYGPVIDLPTLAKSGRQWQFAFGVETDEGEKFLRAFVTAKSSTEEASSSSNPPSTSPPSSSSSDNATRRHNIAVGGTWDHLHAGHKLLLTMTLFLLDPRIASKPFTATIGITGDALLTAKKHAHLLQSWTERQKSCATFTNSIVDFSTTASSQGSRQVSIRDDAGPNGKGVDITYPNGLVVKFTEIQDPFGPTITEQEIEGLVVSGETRSGGKAVNDKRKELGWKELDVYEVDVLDAGEEGEGSVKEGFESKLSSSAIREKLAGKDRGKM
ncbi:uncharacterized protein RCC_01473 [Ramularia collo-cygni]|uniref:Cytidyltransferase-like domain-containing protein n=1 Tax=Ramularia collo-cygni TaxID=112498 RepID=A0A2D3UMR6_9PEZI|nr:uncharacterized protein RCC_01473 [Ramularia collo-cygni]CZT15631.1 uncharacterized protein RCC_01473 [Ramularia collo-cygni]